MKLDKEAFIKWSQKNVKEKYESEFLDGYPIIHCYEDDFKQAFGILKNGEKIEFLYNDLEWKKAIHYYQN